MSGRFGCVILLINLALTLGFGILLVLGYKPPPWGLLAIIVLDIVIFTALSGSRRQR